MRFGWTQRWIAATGPVAMFALSATAEAAEPPEIRLECARIRRDAVDELIARAQLSWLTLREGAQQKDDPKAILVLRCGTVSASWRVLFGERPATDLAIGESAGLLEGAIAALENYSSRTSSPTDTQPAPAIEPPAPEPDAPASGGLPCEDDPECCPKGAACAVKTTPVPPPPRPTVLPSAGGAGLGLGLEVVGDNIGAIGPRLDFGVTLPAPLYVVSTETIRFVPGVDLAMLKLEGGLGWGAPYATGQSVGGVLMGGASWLFRPGDATVSAFSPAITAGVRSTWGESVAWWLGIDATWRTGDVRLGDDVGHTASRVTVVVSFGGLLRALHNDPNKPRKAP